MNTIDVICFRSEKEPGPYGDRLVYKLLPFHILPQSEGQKVSRVSIVQ